MSKELKGWLTLVAIVALLVVAASVMEAALPILQSWRLNPGATQLMPSRRRERPET